ESGWGRPESECRSERYLAAPSRLVRIGVARDAAFQFYYAENLDLLREAGAELHFWSTLCDLELQDVAGLFFGGGYAECHARHLARDHEFHYSTLDPVPDDVERVYRIAGRGATARAEGYRVGRTLMSYVHLHFASNPELPRAFVRACAGSAP